MKKKTMRNFRVVLSFIFLVSTFSSLTRATSRFTKMPVENYDNDLNYLQEQSESESLQGEDEPGAVKKDMLEDFEIKLIKGKKGGKRKYSNNARYVDVSGSLIGVKFVVNNTSDNFVRLFESQIKSCLGDKVLYSCGKADYRCKSFVKTYDIKEIRQYAIRNNSFITVAPKTKQEYYIFYRLPKECEVGDLENFVKKNFNLYVSTFPTIEDVLENQEKMREKRRDVEIKIKGMGNVSVIPKEKLEGDEKDEICFQISFEVVNGTEKVLVLPVKGFHLFVKSGEILKSGESLKPVFFEDRVNGDEIFDQSGVVVNSDTEVKVAQKSRSKRIVLTFKTDKYTGEELFKKLDFGELFISHDSVCGNLKDFEKTSKGMDIKDILEKPKQKSNYGKQNLYGDFVAIDPSKINRISNKVKILADNDDLLLTFVNFKKFNQLVVPSNLRFREDKDEDIDALKSKMPKIYVCFLQGINKNKNKDLVIRADAFKKRADFEEISDLNFPGKISAVIYDDDFKSAICNKNDARYFGPNEKFNLKLIVKIDEDELYTKNAEMLSTSDFALMFSDLNTHGDFSEKTQFKTAQGYDSIQFFKNTKVLNKKRLLSNDVINVKKGKRAKDIKKIQATKSQDDDECVGFSDLIIPPFFGGNKDGSAQKNKEELNFSEKVEKRKGNKEIEKLGFQNEEINPKNRIISSLFMGNKDGSAPKTKGELNFSEKVEKRKDKNKKNKDRKGKEVESIEIPDFANDDVSKSLRVPSFFSDDQNAEKGEKVKDKGKDKEDEKKIKKSNIKRNKLGSKVLMLPLDPLKFLNLNNVKNQSSSFAKQGIFLLNPAIVPKNVNFMQNKTVVPKLDDLKIPLFSFGKQDKEKVEKIKDKNKEKIEMSNNNINNFSFNNLKDQSFSFGKSDGEKGEKMGDKNKE